MADLRNDKGQTETDHCAGFPYVCTWDDVQAWSRELDKRRARAFVWLNVYDASEPGALGVPSAMAEQLRGWADSAAVRDNAHLSQQTLGLPSEERIEIIIGQTKNGDEYLRRIASVAPPGTGPVTQAESETAPLFEPKPWHWAAALALGFYAYRSGFFSRES